MHLGWGSVYLRILKIFRGLQNVFFFSTYRSKSNQPTISKLKVEQQQRMQAILKINANRQLLLTKQLN
jgi:hypothetical protein